MRDDYGEKEVYYSLNRMVARRKELVAQIKELQGEQAEIDRQAKETLISNGALDCLEVNWSRVNKRFI